PLPADASEQEYYVYNGFDAVLGAFQKVALIFGDNGYKTLFFSVVVLGILFGGIAAMARAAGGTRYSPFAWALPVGIGVVIFLALIMPKGTIHLYDPVKNRYQAVGGVPEGIVVLSGILNKVERGLVDIVSTAGDPMSYQDQAGGIGFDMFYNLGTRGVTLANRNLTNNLKNYIHDCVFFELQRPGTALTVNDIMNNTDYLPLFEQAQSPSIFTVYHSDAVPEGQTVSCTAAWTAISAELNQQATYENATKVTCANIGFDPTIPSEYTRCQEIMTNTASYLWGAAYDVTSIERQVAITEAINDVVISASPDTVAGLIASRDTGTSWLAGGMMANEYVPILRAVLTAVMLGLIPFYVLLVPTPIGSKVLTLVAGSFVWLTSWGVTDAVVHQFAVDYAKKAYYEVANNNLGMMAVNGFATASMKTLAVFAGMRWSGLMLATILTGMIIRFGGHALAMMAGHVTGGVSAAASGAGAVAVKPEAGAQTLNALETSHASFANAGSFGYRLRSGIAASARKGYTQRDAGLVGEHGFGGFQKMTAETGRFGMERNYSSIQALGGVENASHVGRMEGVQTLGNIERTVGAAGQAGGIDKFIAMMGSRGASDAAEFLKTAKAVGKEHGYDTDTPEGLTKAAVKTAETRADLSAGSLVTEMRNMGLSGQANMLEYSVAKKMGEMNEIGPLADSGGVREMLNRSGIKGSGIDDGWLVSLRRDGAGNIVQYAARSQDGKTLEKFDGGVITSKTAVDSRAGTFDLEQTASKEGNIIDTRMRGLVKEGTVIGASSGGKLVAGKGTQVEAHGGQITFTGDMRQGNRTFYGRVQGNLSEQINHDNSARIMDTMAEKGSGIIFTNIERGTSRQDGTFVKEGVQKTTYNEHTETGIFKDIDPKTGEETLFYGVKHIDPSTGKVIASQASNIHDKRVYTSCMDENGNRQYGVMHSEGSGDHRGHVYNFKTLSTQDIQKGAYASRMTLSPHGEVLHTEGKSGQDFAHFHRTKFLHDSEARMTYSQGLALIENEKDLSNIADWKRATLYGAEGADKLIGTAGKAIGATRALKNQYPALQKFDRTLYQRSDIPSGAGPAPLFKGKGGGGTP
ncbi:MAG TPA: conjugal transfer protein TraG N-terminal domain-containing protein, partial [Deltaproteobacteria bacterium]|nr:conjugal transfer protein TraG N-terminal domain-containing protein [Deltaproteobacteria bacterium]